MLKLIVLSAFALVILFAATSSRRVSAHGPGPNPPPCSTYPSCPAPK